jgi:hypothetical protein
MMPWRRTSHLVPELLANLREKNEPLSSLHLLGAIELILERVWAVVKIVLLISIVTFVIVVPGGAFLEKQIQRNTKNSQTTTHSADRAQKAANDAATAAAEVKTILQAAIDPNAPSSKASLDAIERIKAIELKLCGGPCPRPPATTSTTTKPPG